MDPRKLSARDRELAQKLSGAPIMAQKPKVARMQIALGGNKERQATIEVPSDLTPMEFFNLIDAACEMVKRIYGAHPGPELVVPDVPAART